MRLAGFNRFQIMPARHFGERRGLAQINHGEIVVGGRVIGVQLDGAAQRRFRRLALALMAQGNTEVILNLRIVRINLRGAAQGFERVVIFFLTELEIAERGKIVSIVGRLDERGQNVLLGFGEFALLQFNRREIGERDTVVLVVIENLDVVRLRSVIFLMHEMCLRGSDQFCGASGHFVNGFLFRIGIGRRHDGGVEQGQFLRCVRHRCGLGHGQPRAQRQHFVVQRGKLRGVVFAGICLVRQRQFFDQIIPILRQLANLRLVIRRVHAGVGGRQSLLKFVLQRDFFQRGNLRFGLQRRHLCLRRFQIRSQLDRIASHGGGRGAQGF